VAVKELGDEIVFLRRLERGGADRSYGVQVARLAGLPAEVIARARQILRDLEGPDGAVSPIGRRGHLPESVDRTQLSLFGSPDSWVEQRLREMDLESMTPLEALVQLAEIKKQLGDS
jgi:DNA mismatch repair protein MutS